VKIMVINPNSSPTVTGAIMESAQRAAAPGTELVAVTTKGGTRNIDSAFGDYLSGAYMIRTCLDATAVHRPDAVVLAGFGRVGIDALREALATPVVSIAEASMAIACLLGHRFTTSRCCNSSSRTSRTSCATTASRRSARRCARSISTWRSA
jgi:allantoin racemase